MKLFLLKTLLIKRSKDKGYVIPVVIALGLIMTLIGTISIFQAGDEEIISISQRESSRALAAAEAGIARYRDFIDRYKVIAMYDACNDWDTINCNDDDSVVSWASTTIPVLNSYCPAQDEDGNNITVDTAVDNMATRGWQNIGDDSSQGQFRLIDYTYNPGTFDAARNRYNDDAQPTGTLTVEGRVGQDNTNLANEDGASVARIQVQLPVQPGLPNVDGNLSVAPFLNRLNPALWIMDANDNLTLGDMRINGSIVVTDTDCDFEPEEEDLDVLFNTAGNERRNTIIADPRSVPIATEVNVNTVTLTDLTTNSVSLPRNSDTETNVKGDDVYYYNLVNGSGNPTNLDLSGGDTINIRNGRKVVLFVEGDIDLDATGGDININPDVVNDSSHFEIYATSNTSRITFDGDGGIYVQGLLHAPESPVTILNDPNVSFVGAMWVENFTGKDLSNTFDINFRPDDTVINEDQYLNYTYVYDFLVDFNNDADNSNDVRIADPIIARPSQWETQQVE